MKVKISYVISILAVFAVGFGVGFYVKANNKSEPEVIHDQVYEEIPPEARAETGNATLYGKIENISLNDKGGSVTFRLVEWVQGSDNQEQAALETGTCTLERIENEECLGDPFFIRDTKKEMVLAVSTGADIEALSPGPDGVIKQDANGNTVFRKITLSDLSKIVADKQLPNAVPFIFTTTQGVISKIKEQYVP
jgi:hypothetical protein